jgi:hypothetical protein
MSPVHAQEDLGRQSQKDYEQWATEQYGHEPNLESQPWKPYNLYQVLVWNEHSVVRSTILGPPGPFQSVQLACPERSTILVIILGHVMALLALLHVVRGKNRRLELDVIGA